MGNAFPEHVAARETISCQKTACATRRATTIRGELHGKQKKVRMQRARVRAKVMSPSYVRQDEPGHSIQGQPSSSLLALA